MPQSIVEQMVSKWVKEQEAAGISPGKINVAYGRGPFTGGEVFFGGSAGSHYMRRKQMSAKQIPTDVENAMWAQAGGDWGKMGGLFQEWEMGAIFGADWRAQSQALMTEQQRAEVAAGTPTRVDTAPQTQALQTATQPAYTGVSIVDYLKSVGQPSDYSSRARLAQEKGITDYMGTAEQNTQLLNLLKSEKPAATVEQQADQIKTDIKTTLDQPTTTPEQVKEQIKNVKEQIKVLEEQKKAAETAEKYGMKLMTQEEIEDTTPTTPADTTTPTTLTTPTTPQDDPILQSLRDSLEAIKKRILESVSPTQEELDLETQLNNLIASREMGIQAAEEQPIATPFITGQAAAITKRAAVQTMPLQARLASLQSKRQAALDVSKVELGFEERELERAEKRAEPPAPTRGVITEAGGRRLLVNPVTGETIADLGEVTGEKKVTDADRITGISNLMGQNIKADGSITADIYVQAQQQWIGMGGSISDFKAAFPPEALMNSSELSRLPSSIYKAPKEEDPGVSPVYGKYRDRLEDEIKNLYAGRYGTEGAREKVLDILKKEFPDVDVAKDIYTKIPDGYEKSIEKEAVTSLKDLPADQQVFINQVQNSIKNLEITYEEAIAHYPAIAVYLKP